MRQDSFFNDLDFIVQAIPKTLSVTDSISLFISPAF